MIESEMKSWNAEQINKPGSAQVGAPLKVQKSTVHKFFEYARDTFVRSLSKIQCSKPQKELRMKLEHLLSITSNIKNLLFWAKIS